MTPDYLTAFTAGIFGALIGSFLNVCISRWPKGESIAKPARSRCPKCGREITWYENIPIGSWIALRGRCAGCGERISWQYPLVELATAMIWAGAFLLPELSTLTAIRVAVFTTVMLGVAVTDAKSYVIPDGFTVFGLFFLLATSVLAAMRGDLSSFASPVDALFGACVGAGAIAIVGWLGEVAFKKEAMGFGDATLMAVCGAALGPERALVNVLVAAAVGSVAFLVIVAPIGALRARRANKPFEMPLVPFGVFLAPAAVLTLAYGAQLIEWYFGLIAP
ncbi:MAG TPA: prepilin peptidase [Gemmatimonadaceae bacterium]|nr:prepilin peptidase [Gemmatimonadaceae bacterium]